MNTAVKIIEFIVGLLTLITIHELGHFLTALWMGIGVEEFGLGLPPRICKIGTLKGVPITLNWLPLGAFVKMTGETKSGVARGFRDAPAWRRLMVVSAGPLVNLIFAVFLFAGAVGVTGVGDEHAMRISSVLSNSPAEQAGLQAGDIITALDGQPFATMNDFHALVNQKIDQPLEITVLRGKQSLTLPLTPKLVAGKGQLGVLIGAASFRPATAQEIITTSTSMSWTVLSGIVNGLKNITISASRDDPNRLVGMVGMYDTYDSLIQDTQTNPLAAILVFFGYISISLFFTNILPIPALDGGRILFLIPQLISGHQIPEKFERVTIAVSMLALICLMLFVNLQEIAVQIFG
jgi:Predicted membrane-associated Zn-dependent proteases 1